MNKLLQYLDKVLPENQKTIVSGLSRLLDQDNTDTFKDRNAKK